VGEDRGTGRDEHGVGGIAVIVAAGLVGDINQDRNPNLNLSPKVAGSQSDSNRHRRVRDDGREVVLVLSDSGVLVRTMEWNLMWCFPRLSSSPACGNSMRRRRQRATCRERRS